MKLAIIGCGHMGTAIVRRALDAGWRVCGSSPHKPPIQHRNFFWSSNNIKILKGAELIVIAVKPKDVAAVLEEARAHMHPSQLLVSIAAGINLKNLARFSGHGKIVRVMPNLPAQIGYGASVWMAPGLTASEKKKVGTLLRILGKEWEAKKEALIDVATAIAGGGPAYTAAFLESLAAAAKKIGFSPAVARELALTAAAGSCAYLESTGIEFADLKKMVATKGGTTEAGFKVLRKKKWQDILVAALLSSFRRAREMAFQTPNKS